MKKKFIIVMASILAFLLSFWLITDYIDSARVRNGIKPIFTINIVSDTGDKITYWGLGYKIIAYPSVSPKEPLNNNIAFKKGNWFMKFNITKVEENIENDTKNYKIVEIIDKTTTQDITTGSALQFFYADSNFKYYYGSIKSEFVVVVFEDGSEITVEEALNEGIITINDLDYWNIKYIKR